MDHRRTSTGGSGTGTRDPLAESKAIQQQTGRTFHVATRLLPKSIRQATYILYAFFRIADDVVDDPNPPPAADRRAALARIRDEALGVVDSDDAVMQAFTALRAEYGISDREVREFITAMEQDVEASRYETFADLEAYLRGSSVAVAYMMLSVMDPDDHERARPHAKALGEAFQLTNFLRDVREDVLKYGRIYLPRDTLAKHDVSDEQVFDLTFSEGFAAAMQEELTRTEALYRTGVDGIETLPRDCQFPVLTAAVLYADHHRLIRNQGYDVLSHRPTLSMTRRVSLVLRTWIAWRRTGDPRAAFEAVGVIPAIPDESDTDPARDDVQSHAESDRYTPTRSTGLLTGLVARLPLGVFR